MIIKSQYLSYCGCGCGSLITVGSMINWEKGKKPIKPECMLLAPEDIISNYKINNPASKMEFIGEADGRYTFTITRKDGKMINAVYYKNGERVSK